jgi:hypothetical protein
LAGARDKVSTMRDGVGDVTVYFRGGQYPFTQTVVFGLKDSGSENQVITYRNYPGETPVFTSGVRITGWRKIRSSDFGYDQIPAVARDQVYIADVSEVLKKTGLFHFLLDNNAEWLPRAMTDGFSSPRKHELGASYGIARWWSRPPEQKMDLVYDETAPIRNWDNIEDVEIRIITGVWSMNLLPVSRVDTEKKVLYTKVPATYPMWGFTDIRANQDAVGQRTWVRPEKTIWVENTLDGLREKGNWAVNTRTKKLYLWPATDTDQIYAPCLKELVRVEGAIDYWGPKDVPVKYIRFQGITFTGGDRDVLQPDDSGIQHDWEMEDKNSAMLRFRGTENCTVDSCRFVKSGGTGVRFDLHSQYNTVRKCFFDLLGMSGVFFGGYGPGTKDVNHHNQVLQNEITRVGQTKWDSHGVIIWQSGYNRIAQNYIHNVPRKAICMSGPRPAFLNPQTPTREFSWKTTRRKDMPDLFNGDGSMTPDMSAFMSQGQGGGMGTDITAKYRYLNGNVVEYNTVHDALQKLDDGSAINITGGGTGDNFGSPNIVRLNYLYNINGGDAMMRMDGSAPWSQFKNNVFYHSKVPFGILCFGWGLFTGGNVFLDVHPTNARWYVGSSSTPIPFSGNLIFDQDWSKATPIDYSFPYFKKIRKQMEAEEKKEAVPLSKYAPWLDDFHEIYRVLDGNYLPGKLEGVEEIKTRLREAIQEMRAYYKPYEQEVK